MLVAVSNEVVIVEFVASVKINVGCISQDTHRNTFTARAWAELLNYNSALIFAVPANEVIIIPVQLISNIRMCYIL